MKRMIGILVAATKLIVLGALVKLAAPAEDTARADTWEYTVYVNGRNLGIFDYKDGGEVDSDLTTYKPGGMRPPVPLGGSKTTGNVTMRRAYRLGRDHPQSQRLIDAVGRGQVRIVGQPLDHDANPFGVPFTYHGTLKRCTLPQHDSTSSDAAMLELEITVAGYPTGMSG